MTGSNHQTTTISTKVQHLRRHIRRREGSPDDVSYLASAGPSPQQIHSCSGRSCTRLCLGPCSLQYYQLQPPLRRCPHPPFQGSRLRRPVQTGAVATAVRAANKIDPLLEAVAVRWLTTIADTKPSMRQSERMMERSAWTYAARRMLRAAYLQQQAPPRPRYR